jgi:hypothetical protein
MLIPFVVLVISCFGHLKPFRKLFIGEVLGLLFIAAIGGVFVYFGYSARNAKFVLSDEGLRIEGAMYGRSIAKDSLVLQKARVMNLAEDAAYQPAARTNGVGLPGYLEGWFRLKNKEKALVFITSRNSIVYIPTKEGYSVMLSVSEPKEFCEEVSKL